MKKLILATVAAASLLSGSALLTQPAHAAVRCWWNGWGRHCAYTHPGWRYYHHPWWWYRY
ncbi:MAG TPA: hypothetical protein VM755_20420 [Stellaceae bacterium]|nr:hypothetical protein [Stellaceae bacterium]